MKTRVAYFFILVFLYAVQAQATTRYVRNGVGGGCSNGSTNYRPATNDCGVGGTDTVYTTIKNGVNAMSPGDTLDIRGGTYSEYLNENLGTTFPRASSWATASTIQAHPGETVNLSCDGTQMEGNNPYTCIDTTGNPASYYLIFKGTVTGTPNDPSSTRNFIWDGIHLTNGGTFIHIESKYVRIDGIEIKNNLTYNPNSPGQLTGGCGVLIHGDGSEVINSNIWNNGPGAGINEGGYSIYAAANDLIIANNLLHDNAAYGMQIYNSDGPRNNVQVYGNRVYNNGLRDAVNNTGLAIIGTNHKVYNNLAYNNAGAGISDGYYGGPNTGTVFYNNTVYGNGAGLQVESQTPQTTWRNNIAYGNGTNVYYRVGVAPLAISNNLCNSIGTGCDYGTFLSPFVDAANGNFQLTSTSTAKDAGADLGVTYNRDFANVFRPQGSGWDIGAYEWEVTTPPPGTPTPVLALGLNEGSGTIANDSSGQGNNGTLVNATWFPTGRFGQAVQLSGAADSYIRVPHSASLNLSSAGMTLSAWIYPTSFPVDPNQFTSVMYKYSAGDNSAYFLFAKTSGAPNDYVCANGYAGGGFTTSVINKACETTGPVLTESWTHLAVTYDGTDLRFYRNGQKTETRAASEPLGTNSSDLIIGNSFFGEALTGLIDEVRIYNYALNDAEIAAMYLMPIEQEQVVTQHYKVAPATDVKVSAATLIKKGAQ